MRRDGPQSRNGRISACDRRTRACCRTMPSSKSRIRVCIAFVSLRAASRGICDKSKKAREGQAQVRRKRWTSSTIPGDQTGQFAAPREDAKTEALAACGEDRVETDVVVYYRQRLHDRVLPRPIAVGARQPQQNGQRQGQRLEPFP